MQRRNDLYEPVTDSVNDDPLCKAAGGDILHLDKQLHINNIASMWAIRYSDCTTQFSKYLSCFMISQMPRASGTDISYLRVRSGRLFSLTSSEPTVST
jgi:hypothetical protein